MKKVLAAVAVAMTLPMTVMAWEPTGDVTVIVAYKAGSGTDTGARLLATEAQKYIPKTIIIQNLPGADGKIGWTKLVQSKPDGKTSASSTCRHSRLWLHSRVLPSPSMTSFLSPTI